MAVFVVVDSVDVIETIPVESIIVEAVIDDAIVILDAACGSC